MTCFKIPTIRLAPIKKCFYPIFIIIPLMKELNEPFTHKNTDHQLISGGNQHQYGYLLFLKPIYHPTTNLINCLLETTKYNRMASSVYAAKQHIFCLLIFSAYAKHNTWVTCTARCQVDTFVSYISSQTEPPLIFNELKIKFPNSEFKL